MPDTSAMEPEEESKLPSLLRVVLVIWALVAVVALAGLILGFLSQRLRGGGRIVVGVLLGLAILWIGVGYFRQLANPPPPEAPPTDVHPSLRLAYVCEMCGMELAVVKVAKEKPPKHCAEPMVLVRRTE